MCQCAYESSFRPVLLPSVAAAEVFRDLKTQADDEGFKDSQVALELAACYFNGSLTYTDMDLGMKYFSMAIALGNQNAIGSAMNVFEASDYNIPPHIKQTLSETGPDGILPAISDLVTPLFPATINHASVRANTWARIFPDDYASLKSGDERHAFNSEIIKGFQLPDPSQLTEVAHSGMPDFDHMLSVESAVFVNEVRQLGCLNSVNECGLTLLQTSVARNDLPMVKILIRELQADVNMIGTTAGWTPLWLSCLLGYHDIAMFLRDNGADPTCRDTDQGTTILHTLSQFSGADQVRDIVNMALGADLDINVCNSNGMTPLHATFSGWDYSQGAAARVLLERGADPTRQAPDKGDFMTPIALCMRNLDFNLLEAMVAAVKNLPGVSNLGIAKVQAFRWLLNRTRFYFMCVVGKGYEAALTSVLRLIVDADMVSELRSDKLVTLGSSPLFSACHLGRGHIVRALLEAFPDLDLDSVENDPLRERSCLHLALERRSRECVQILLDNGAGILLTTPTGQNALHAAAKFCPSFVPQLVSLVEAMSPEQRCGKTMKEVLDLRKTDGSCVFGMLLWEGYSVEIAESIRSKYDLDYDSLVDYGEGNSSTLTDLTIAIAEQGLLPVGHVRYLLDLSPPPRFVCRGDGSTLLTRAVAGWRSRKSQTI
jgi:ankyrin repeat protein